MKLKIFSAVLLLTSSFCVPLFASAQDSSQLQQQLVQLEGQLVQTLAQQQGTESWCYTFSNSLGYVSSGSTGAMDLHVALQKEGISYSPDDAVTYSTGTEQGVVKFQKKYNISPQTGFAGPKTIAKLNQLYGCVAPTAVTCTPAWQCNDWSLCLSGQQSRTCTDSNNCGLNTNEPKLAQSCTQQAAVKIQANKSDGPLNIFLTLGSGATVSGAVINLSENINLQWMGVDVSSCSASDSLTPSIFSGFEPSSGSASVLLSGNIQTAVTAGKVSDSFKITCVSTATGSQVSDNVVVNLFYTANTACSPNWSCGSWGGCNGNQQTRVCTDLSGCGTVTGKPAITQSCTAAVCTPSWQTGDWGTCSYGQQTRTVTDANNCGLITSKPTTTQSCTAATCTPNWQTSAWGICMSGQQSRTVTDSNNCGTINNKPVTSQACCAASCLNQTDGTYAVNCSGALTKCPTGNTCQLTYSNSYVYVSGVAQTAQTLTGAQCVCTPSWQSGAWGSCSYGQQTRTVTDSNNCGTTTGKPATTQSCTAAVCTPSWQLGDWSSCSYGQQIRTVTDSNNCGLITNKPATSQTCTVAACTPSWQLGAWGTCSYSQQTRTVIDANNCGVTTNKPATSQSCTAAACTPNWQTGAWGTCTAGQQTRTVIDSNSCGTTLNKPTVSQSCCAANCLNQSDGIYSVGCSGTVTKCPTGKTCQLTYTTNYVYVSGVAQTVQTLTGAQCVCTPNWQTGAWGTCSYSQQTRIVTDANNCGVTTNKPATSQSCTAVACTPNWQTGAWGTCTAGQQTRTVTDSNNCGVKTGEPVTSQTCCAANCLTQTDGVYAINCFGTVTKCSAGNTCQLTYSTSYLYNTGSVQTVQTLTGSQCVCTPNWQTGAWGTCTAGQQTRTVTDSNGCGTTTNKPVTSQSCT